MSSSMGWQGAVAIHWQRKRYEAQRRTEKLRKLTAEERKAVIQIEKQLYNMHERRKFQGSSFELLYLGIIFIGVAIGIYSLGLMIHESLFGVSVFLFFIGIIIICLYYCIRNEEDEELKHIKKQYEKAKKVTDRLGYDIELSILGRTGTNLKNYDTLASNPTASMTTISKNDVENEQLGKRVIANVKKTDEYELEVLNATSSNVDNSNSTTNQLTESETSQPTIK